MSNEEKKATVSELIFTGVKKQSATEMVIETIKDLLVTKKLLPGDKLPSESDLAEGLHVSRGSIREAMKILNAYGVVDIRRGDGTYISITSEGSMLDPLLFKLIFHQDSFDDLKNLREMIEIGIVKLVIENATDEDINELESAYNYALKMVAAGNYEGEVIREAELKFHTAFGEASKNMLVQTIYNYVMELFIPNIYKDKDDEEFGPEALASHRPIIDAIKARDIHAGEQAIHYSMHVWKEQTGRRER